MKLSSLPRVKLANLPTPLQELPNLSKALNGPRIFVKRDDMTGLAFGGNKTRKLEYLMSEVLEYKSDYIVTGAGFHSNWCTQTAAAARRLGMKVVLIKSGPQEGYDPEEYDGNHLLHFLQGAEIKVVRPEDGERAEQETMEELKAKGHKPYLLTATGSTPPGAAGYMNAMLELLGQAVASGIDIDYLVHATGSGGTQAGLIIGAKAFNTNVKVIGATTGSRSRDEQFEKVSDIIDGSLKLLDLDDAREGRGNQNGGRNRGPFPGSGLHGFGYGMLDRLVQKGVFQARRCGRVPPHRRSGCAFPLQNADKSLRLRRGSPLDNSPMEPICNLNIMGMG